MVNYRQTNSEAFFRSVQTLQQRTLAPLDVLPHDDFCEKCIELVVNGEPKGLSQDISQQLSFLRSYLLTSDVKDIRVVVFGGGSGLSNVIGGDSRLEGWAKNPFMGLKEVFPSTSSVVCVTDDGGSTGELIKDLPLIALGDIRHVLLSSIQRQNLMAKYDLSASKAQSLAEVLAIIFNTRFAENGISDEKLTALLERYGDELPEEMAELFSVLFTNLFADSRLSRTLHRPHCLGNLLLASAIYLYLEKPFTNEVMEERPAVVSEAVLAGIELLGRCIGVALNAVTPCSTIPAQLRFCYSNGVEATGECKSGESGRGYPVDHVTMVFSDDAMVPERILRDIEDADILVMAPGSLYSSIIPVFQVPGLADAVRSNKRALKMLISNLWVQTGETDISMADPERKFHVSDMIRAYERNIPGGIAGLFNEVLCLSLKDIPGSVLQNYALEGKLPIYLDRDIVLQQGFKPVECGIYSKKALADRGVIQHDPDFLAAAVKTIFLARSAVSKEGAGKKTPEKVRGTEPFCNTSSRISLYPSKKYRHLASWAEGLRLIFSDGTMTFGEERFRHLLIETIWKHQDVPLKHLDFFEGIQFIEKEKWKRNQRWDNVFSFYDPYDRTLKIRSDQIENPRNFETALLIAMGQSLLGNYASGKRIAPIEVEGVAVGKIYHLVLEEEGTLKSFFSMEEIFRYLRLARMNRLAGSTSHFIRVVNGEEGFTPPGVLMGLCYAWYLDNRLASHIEYKMALMKISESDLIPEQRKMKDRRNSIIEFFREVVFKG